jgi:hypothetical protein
MEADRQRLIDRILKLLAVANSTTFDAEADTARKLAEALMAKHNIDAVSDGKTDRAGFTFMEYEPAFKGAKWEFMLADAVCDLTGCAIFWMGDFQMFKFAGLVPDAEACLYIVKKLHEQRMAQWMDYKAKQGGDSFFKFCFGFAQGVAKKIDILVKPMAAIKANQKAARLWFEQTYGARRASVKLGDASSQAGLRSGAAASFHRGEMGGPQRLLR